MTYNRALHLKKEDDIIYKKVNEFYHEIMQLLSQLYNNLNEHEWLIFVAPQKTAINFNSTEEQRKKGLNVPMNIKYSKYLNRRIDGIMLLDSETYKKKNNEITIKCIMELTDLKKNYFLLNDDAYYDQCLTLFFDKRYYFGMTLLFSSILMRFAFGENEQKYCAECFEPYFNRPIWEITLEELRQAIHDKKTITFK